MDSCVDFLADKLDRRLRRQKEKIKSHKLGRRLLPDLDVYRAARRTLADGARADAAPAGEAIDAAEVLRFEQARRRMVERHMQ